MQTGENEQALRKIIDFTRLLSIAMLLIHFYLSCYDTFQQHHLAHRNYQLIKADIATLVATLI